MMTKEIYEIEIKAYCDNPREVIKRLAAIGAEFVETRIEQDLYFNHPLRDFGLTDEALRLRYVNGKSKITYKGPKVSSETKARIEYETGIDDIDVVVKILLALGFSKSGEIKKRREVYVSDGMEITLDHVENLGDFVEIEKQAAWSENAEKELFDTAAGLGLSRFERRSYLELKYFS